jgi:DNA-binding response OmpR family regulator
MKPRLLVIEDEEPIAFAMTGYFEALEYDVDWAAELEEAKALVRNCHYDAMIADLRLTRVHGREGLDLLRYAREFSPWTRTVLLTAYLSPEMRDQALEEGAALAMQKPQELRVLAAAVDSLVDRTDA